MNQIVVLALKKSKTMKKRRLRIQRKRKLNLRNPRSQIKKFPMRKNKKLKKSSKVKRKRKKRRRLLLLYRTQLESIKSSMTKILVESISAQLTKQGN